MVPKQKSSTGVKELPGIRKRFGNECIPHLWKRLENDQQDKGRVAAEEELLPNRVGQGVINAV